MTTVSFEQFVDQLTASGLMTADDLGAFTDGLPANQKPNDAEALARLLIAAKKLTPFQAQQIWKGKAKHLVLGNYVISEKIGEGGMGMVFRASHKVLKRDVALKVLSPSVIKDKNAVKRFLREVEAAAKLTHPNIVAALDADQASGTYYLIMEFVEGRDLSIIVKKQGPAKIDQAVDCILQAARGLEFAHRQGVIHRDIKPANLLMDKSGTVKVLDMGLARFEDSSTDAATQAGLTGTGTIMGTIDYMSPEQADDSKRAGPQADIYSLGASLYFLLVGKPMIKGDTLGKKLRVLLTGVGLPDSICSARSSVPAELDAIFGKMTAFDMNDRYRSMTEVIADLEALKTRGASTSAPTSTSTAGISPLAAGRSNDSAMQSFLNNLNTSTATPDSTEFMPPKTADAPPETMANSVGDSTRPAIKRTTAVKTPLKKPQRGQLVIGAGVVGVMLLGLLIWAFSGRENDANKSASNSASKPKTSGAPSLAVAPLDAEQAKISQEAWAKHLGLPVEKEINLPGGAKMTFMLIPPGEFQMGSSKRELDRLLRESDSRDQRVIDLIRSEGSQHQVRITRPFYMGKYEVTQSQWQSVMNDNPSANQESLSHPVEKVSWAMIQSLLKKLNQNSQQEQGAFKLPTEAQWEYACRAGTTTTWHCGDSYAFLLDYAWCGSNANQETHPVGELMPNNWNLYDMHGNVREWCADLSDADYYQYSPTNDPTGPANGSDRVLRGGSWREAASASRSASRDSKHVGYQYANNGFRLAMTIGSSAPTADPNRTAAEWVLSIGGSVETDVREFKDVDQLPTGPFQVVSVGLVDNRKVTSGGIQHLEGLTKLTRLDISRSSLGREGLLHLEGLLSLKYLDLGVTGVGDAEMESLKNVSSNGLYWLANRRDIRLIMAM